MRHILVRILFVCLCCLLVAPFTAWAHFALVLPSDDVVSSGDAKTLAIEVAFLHPFEQTYMDMALPRRFGVMYRDIRDDLLSGLRAKHVQGMRTWHASYRIRRPGAYVFYIEPEPYWEPAERKFIVHCTKVVVGALGLDEGWDALAGLPVEIEPLVRPFGNWTGNVFRGVVKKEGKPVPFAEIEVEYLNQKRAITAPDDTFVTQVIKADANGVFTYAMPRGGWWGFAALVEADYTMKHEGKPYPVELGGVIWIRARDMGAR